jgi:peptide/nickel transport system permease protein
MTHLRIAWGPYVTRYILRRLLLLVPVLIIVALIVFGLVHLTPGDPASMMLGRDATIEQKEALREQLGLNKPVWEQFVDWTTGAIRGDFGDSLFIGKPVTEALLERAQPTVLLTVYSLVISIAIAIPAGVIAGIRPNSLIDRLLMVMSISGAAIPSFFFGIILILLFAVRLGWLPSGGYVDVGDGLVQHLKYMILPSITLGFSAAGLLARLVRSTMLDVLNQDYIRTAYAKGLREKRVVLGHALRNAMIPAMTVIGIMLANMLGGAVVIETVFNVPGMGRLIVQSVTRRDFPVVQGAVLLIAVIEVLVMLAIDIIYVFIDPRIRYVEE